MADAPKLLGTDTLRTAYPKVNIAIDNANEALRNSEDALDKATQALANSENTQAQLDQIVIEGDSSVEAAQARVDAEGNVFTTLKERLDIKETAFNEQIVDNTKKIDILSKKDLDQKPFSLQSAGISNLKYNHFGLMFKARDGIIIFHYESESHQNNNGRIVKRKSYDGGATLTDYVQIVSDEYDNRGIGGCVLPNGRIVLVFTKTNIGATITIGHFSMYSDDNGETWSTPKLIDAVPYDMVTMIYGKAVVVGKTIFQSYYRYTPTGTQVGLLKSTNNGETWELGPTIYEGSENVTECALEAIGKEVFAVIRNENKTLKQFYSNDGGNTFIFLRDITFSGEYPVSPFLLLIPYAGKQYIFLYYFDRDSSTLKRRYATIDYFRGTSAFISSAKNVKTSMSGASGYPSAIFQNDVIKVMSFDEKTASQSDISILNEFVKDIADFETDWISITKNTSYQIAHNLGVKPSKIETYISQDPNAYPILNNGDTIKASDVGTSVRVDQMNIYIGTGANGIFAFFYNTPSSYNVIQSGYIKVKLYV